MNKEKFSVRLIDGEIKVIGNDDEGACSGRNRDDEETTNDENPGNAVQLLEKKQQKGNIKRNRDDQDQTTDDQNSGHAVRLLDRENRNRNRDDQNQTTDDQNQNSGHEVRLLDRKKRRERLQEEKEKKAAIVRCFVFET